MKSISATPITDEMMKKMQSILTALKIKVEETILQQEEYSYSTKLVLPDYDWTIYGQGRTEEACRAEAYLNLITAIQHLQFPEHFYNSLRGREDSDDILYVYPDAKIRDIRKPILQSLLSDMEMSLSCFKDGYANTKTLLNHWIEWNGSPKFAFVPFYSLKGNKKVMLPYRIVNKLCYPYNVASGRTYEEALAHALIGEIKRCAGRILGCNPKDSADIVRDEWGQRCPELYMQLNSLEPSPTGEVSKEKLNQLIDMCYKIVHEVYVRDNSFLGIPSVCVYIPGVSPVMRENILQEERKLATYTDDEILRILSEHNNAFHNMYDFHLMEAYESESMAVEDFLSGSINELVAAYHIYRNDTGSALSTLYQEPRPSKHVRAIICELEMKKEGADIRSRNWMLTMLFGKDCSSFIQNYWRNRDAFAHFFNNIIDEPIEERLKGISFPYRILSLVNRVKGMIGGL